MLNRTCIRIGLFHWSGLVIAGMALCTLGLGAMHGRTDPGLSYRPVLSVTLKGEISTMEKPVECSLYDTEGNLVTLSRLRGAPVVILIAESWCGGCQISGYRMTELYHKYKSKNVRFLTVIPNEGIPQLIDYKNHGTDIEQLVFKIFIFDNSLFFMALLR